MSGEWKAQVQAHRVRTRRTIIDAALALVSEHGLAGTTMSALADRAGVSRATLYKYFPDVPHVMLAWALQEIGRAVDRLELELQQHAEPAIRLEVFVTELLKTWAGADHRFGVEQLSTGLPPHDVAEMHRQMRRLHTMLTGLLTEGARDGSLQADLDPEVHADLVLHMLMGLRTVVVREDRPVADVARWVAQMLRHGLAAEPERPTEGPR